MIHGFARANGAIAKTVSLLQSVGKSVQAGQKIWTTYSNQVRDAGRKLAGTGVAMGASLMGAAKAASTFQTQMVNVQSLTKASDLAMGRQTKSILNMSTRMPQSSTEMAAGLYDIASSGYAGADGLKVLEASAISASAGMTNSAVASKAIVATMNAYGLSAREAADVSDTLFQGVNVGVMTFEELASSMGDWVGMAAQVGISAQEGTAAIAAMTLAGISAGESGTYLSRIMQQFIDPTEKMKAAVKDMGYASPKALVDAKGLGGALMDLTETTGGSVEEFNGLFGSIQAVRGAMAITANGGKNWDRVASQITSKTARAGAAQKVFAYQSETLSAKWQMMQNSMKNLAITIGTPLLKPLAVLMGWFTSVIALVTQFASKFGSVIAGFGALGSVVATVAGGFAMLFPKVVAARTALAAFRALNAAFTGQAAASGIAGLLANLGTRFPKLTAMVTGFGKAIKTVLGLDMIQGTMTAIRTGFTGVGKTMTGLFTGTTSLKNVGMAAMGGVSGVAKKGASSAWNFISSGVGMTSIAIAGLTAALVGAYQGFTQATAAGKEMATEFKANLSDKSFGDIRSGILKLDAEIERSMNKEAGIFGNKGGFFGMSTGKRAAEASKMVLLDWLPFGDLGSNWKRGKQEQTYRKELAAERRRMAAREEKVRLAAALAAESAMGANSLYDSGVTPAERLQGPGAGFRFGSGLGFTKEAGGEKKTPLAELLIDKGQKANKQWIKDNIANVAAAAGSSTEEMMFRFDQGMQATGISIDDLFDPQKYQESFTKISDYMEKALGKSTNKVSSINAFQAMRDAAGDAKSQVEQLGQALKSLTNQALGPQAATDNLMGMINQLKEGSKSLGKKGLADAMNFDSFSEQALNVRGQWRGIVDAMIEETTAWANSQENLTGVDVAQHVQQQSDKIRLLGASMGYTNEFMEVFVGQLQEAVASGDIVTNFTNNADEAYGAVTAYLTTIGRTPEQITTVIDLINADVSTDQLSKLLASMGMTPQQIMTVMKVHVEDASAQIQTYLDTLGEVDQKKLMTAIIKLTTVGPDGQPAQKESIKKQFGLNDEQINMIMTLSGEGLGQSLVLKKVLEDVGAMTPQPTVNVTDNASAILTGIQAKLNDIGRGRQSTVTVNQVQGSTLAGGIDGDPTTPIARGGILGYAAGGLAGAKPERPGTAGIYSPMSPGRLFAEPVTGGEAYIPMSEAKRARSLSIWKEVGSQFGYDMTAYARGGVAGKKKPAKAAPSTEESRQKERDQMAYRVEVDRSASKSDELAMLLRQKSQLPAFSDEWMQVGRAADEAAKALRETGYAAQDAFLDVGAIDNKRYLQFLQERQAQTQMYSDEWWKLGVDIFNKQKDIANDRKDLEDEENAAGNLSVENRIKQLRTRLAEEKRGSKEWMQIQTDIRSEEMKNVERQAKYGGISNDTYLAFLKKRLSEAEKFSDNWAEITDKISQIEIDATKNVADVYAKFGDKKSVSASSVIKYLEKQVAAGQKWADTIAQLKASGAYDQNTLQQIIDGGPQSAGLAEALLKATTSGQSATIQGLLDQAMRLGMNTNSAAYLPPGNTLAYNGSSRASAQGGNVLTVNLPNATISSPNDAQRFGDRVAFALNSASL
jgi:TP901 family phage tail tape measure protein